jgi:uncharacterized protein YciI
MLFSIHALDKPDIAAKLQAVHAEHIAHLKAAKNFGVGITVGGPLVADDGKSPIGSLIVIEAPDRAAADKFYRADPFFTNGIWATVEVQRYDRKQ